MGRTRVVGMLLTSHLESIARTNVKMRLRLWGDRLFGELAREFGVELWNDDLTELSEGAKKIIFHALVFQNDEGESLPRELVDAELRRLLRVVERDEAPTPEPEPEQDPEPEPPEKLTKKNRHRLPPPEGIRIKAMAKVDKTNPDGCWDWMGCGSTYGSSMTIMYHGTRYHARRVVEYLETGVYPAPGRITFACGNRMCVNPAHREREST